MAMDIGRIHHLQIYSSNRDVSMAAIASRTDPNIARRLLRDSSSSSKRNKGGMLTMINLITNILPRHLQPLGTRVMAQTPRLRARRLSPKAVLPALSMQRAATPSLNGWHPRLF